MIYRGFMARGLFKTLVGEYKLDGAPFYLLFIGLMLACIVIPYLLGSMNFGIIISKIKYGDDIRKHGSGNGGTTNMLRTYGKGMAALTLVCDMLKCVVSVTLGCALMGLMFGGYLAGLFCILGHMFPIYYRFKGGKGVACLAAMILMLNPVVFAILFVMFVIIVAFSKYVSLGSVMCALIYPVLLNRMDLILADYLAANDLFTGTDTLIAVLVAVLVVFMHRENIKRLLAGTESKISLGKGKGNGKNGK